MTIKRNWKKYLSALWVVGGMGFILWIWVSMQAKGVDASVFESNNRVLVVQTKEVISFTPTGVFSKVVLFYPGALVDPDAYAPLCRKIADSGYKVLLIKMPCRLASKGYTKPLEMGLLADSTKQYYLAGHSQGAKMAAQFVLEHPGIISGLILLGTTHPRDINLSKETLPVLKIYGSNDGVASPADVEFNKPKLPGDAKYVLIQGANHSQFGYYGSQLGDNQPAISRQVQQRLLSEAIVSFLDKSK